MTPHSKNQKMNFLFDIGNVIVGIDFIPALESLIPSGTDNASERIQTLLERKDLFETGKIPLETYFPWAAKTLGFTGSQEEFFRAWNGIFTPNPPIWESIHQIHAAGHQLILFSNINEPHIHHLKQTYPIFEKFHGNIFSYQTGYIKPDPAIYQFAIKKYHLTPETTVYIDDLPANIATGKKMNFLSHLYDINDHESFVHWLHTLQI